MSDLLWQRIIQLEKENARYRKALDEAVRTVKALRVAHELQRGVVVEFDEVTTIWDDVLSNLPETPDSSPEDVIDQMRATAYHAVNRAMSAK